MRTLFLVAAFFVLAIGGLAAYSAYAGHSGGYDLSFVLPIDTKGMPKPPATSTRPVVQGRAEAGATPDIAGRPLISFGNRPGSASETQSSQ